jgi:DNA repair protein RecO (recombination protein O)
MPSYNVKAINIGSFLLGESDKVLTILTAERGILKAVAKGARKPGTKMSGRADVLCTNALFLSSGRTFEIITQAECIDTFPEFRTDLTRMSYGLYYAELTQHFAQGISIEESESYFDYLYAGLVLQARSQYDPVWLSLEFELGLLDMLGYRPELTYCVSCREVLGDYNISTFNRDLGGVLCQACSMHERSLAAREKSVGFDDRQSAWSQGSHITPLVWKNLVLAADRRVSEDIIAAHGLEHIGVTAGTAPVVKPPIQQSVQAARKLIHGYIEHRAGRHMKALDILEQISK